VNFLSFTGDSDRREVHCVDRGQRQMCISGRVALVAGLLLLELAELPHAATARAVAASPVAPNMFRIRIFSPSRYKRYPLSITYRCAYAFT